MQVKAEMHNIVVIHESEIMHKKHGNTSKSDNAGKCYIMHKRVVLQVIVVM